MGKNGQQSPLLGYNTNVRHAGLLFHIQTEDSGVGHPHVITHLFVEGTILATKKTSYEHLIDKPDMENGIRRLMKDQHRSMFIELRDGTHDTVSARILKKPVGQASVEEKKTSSAPEKPSRGSTPPNKAAKNKQTEKVHVVRPSVIVDSSSLASSPEGNKPKPKYTGRSIFDIMSEDSDFGGELITDKSLDEVILSYLTDEDSDE